MPPVTEQNPWMNLMNLYGPQAPNNGVGPLDPNAQTIMNSQVNQALQSDAGDGTDGGAAINAMMAQPQPNSSAPAQDLSGLQRAIAAFNPDKISGIQLTKDEIQKLKDYRDKMPSGGAGPNLQGLMSLADAWGQNKSNFSGNYVAPKTAAQQEADKAAITEALEKAGQGLTTEQLSAAKDALTGAVAGVHYGQASGTKQAEQDDKGKKQFIDYMSAENKSGRFGGVAKAWNQIASTQRLEALMQKYKDNPNDITPQESDELTQGVMAMLAPQNPSSDLFNHLVSPNVEKTSAGIKQWLFSEPQGANQGEFVKRTAGTIGREKQANQNILNEFYKNGQARFGEMGWAKRDPGAMNRIMDTFVNSSAATQPAFTFGAQPQNQMPDIPESQLKVGDIVDGHKYLGGPAKKPSSWGAQ